MISDKKKFIYIHIPKCAGTTVTRLLLDHSEDIDSKVRGKSDCSIMVRRPDDEDHRHFGLSYMHASALELRDFMGEDKFNDYYKFSVIRNTYDRLISLYFWAENSPVNFNEQRFKYLLNINANDGRLIVDFKFSKIPQARGSIPQNFFICDHKNEKEEIIVDRIVRFDNLEQDMMRVCDDIGINHKNFKVKTNTSKHVHYSEYYNQELIDLVDSIYEREIIKFGFSFEDRTGRGLKGILC